MRGTILSGTNNIFEAECADNAARRCTLKGKKLKDAKGFYNPLAPGDEVEIEIDEIDFSRGQITALFPRKNSFVRWNVKGRAPQLLAANIDNLFCVTTPDEPPFRPRFIDRVLSQAEYAGIAPIILVNKCDLAFSPECETRLAEWEKIGYCVLRVSAKTGEGLSAFSKMLTGKLSAFVGQSGVGKSSLLNALDPTLSQRTAELSDKYGRGTHTTTQGILLHITVDGADAKVIDTPGVRRFVLHGIDARDLALYFPEMRPLAGTCTYGMSCSHTGEDGCAILAAVDSGGISAERYESWLRISEEIASGSWAD